LNLVDNFHDDEEGSDHDEDHHEANEVDPRFANAGEEDIQPDLQVAPQVPIGDPWHDDKWVEVPIQENPMVNRRFHQPEPAPFIPVVHIRGEGAKSIPLGTVSESQFLELIYDDEILGRYVDQTNLKVSLQPDGRRAWSNRNRLTIDELKKYMAVELYMDIVVREGDLKGYWSRGMWGDKFVKECFTRHRFFSIRNNLTWTDTTNVTAAERAARNVQDGFWTINGLFDAVKEKYKNFIFLNQN
jgi:hypothetical protein